jgi:hypothetical protein
MDAMRTSATAEQLEYLAELGVSVLATRPVESLAPVAAVPLPPALAAAHSPAPAPPPVFVPVIVPMPEPKTWWGKNSWWIGLLVVLLKLIVFFVMKGCIS